MNYLQERWSNIRCLTASNCFMSENAVVWFTRSLWRECLIESNHTAYRFVFFGGEIREYNNSLHISGKTTKFLWDGLLVSNTSLSIPYFVFGIGYAFCILTWVVIRIFDVVLAAEAKFTLLLCRSWKTNIFRFKNIIVCFITNFIVFFVFWKVFLHFLYWQFWIKISLCMVHSCVYRGWLLNCCRQMTSASHLFDGGWLPLRSSAGVIAPS